MSNFSALIPIAHMEAANAELDALGFGPSNFSVPVKSASSTGADYAGFHCWDIPDFRAAVEVLDPAYGVVIEDGDGEPNFDAICAKEGKEWVKDWKPFDGQQSTLPMTGDKRMHDGKEWQSLVDYNVWLPPVGWREVVVTGYPSWVQPTGAHDAYALGAKVAHNGANWESTIANGVWEPGVYGWKQIA